MITIINDLAIVAAAANSCVKEDLARRFVMEPEVFLKKNYDRFWCWINADRNYGPRLVDDWFSYVIREYSTYGKDIGLELFPVHELRGPKNAFSIDDVISIHLQKKIILVADIEHFYDNISFDIASRFLPPSIKNIIKMVYFNDSGIGIKCGLRGSSFIADIIGNKIIDKLSKRLLYEKGYRDVAYSRYCDDLFMSSSNYTILRKLELDLSTELQKIGFKLKREKTKIKPINSNVILGRNIHDGKIIISKKRRNRARMKFYNALTAYRLCNKRDLDSVKNTLSKIESALGLANYINRYSIVKECIILQLENAYSDLLELKGILGDSPFL